MYEEVTDSVFLDREEDIAHDFDWGKTNINNAHLYEEQYEHPVWKEYLAEGVQGTHDGMDWLEFRTFFRALRENAPMPIDVYDAASWMAITVLSEMSIARGGAVVDIPDFTNGKWDSEILPREYLLPVYHSYEKQIVFSYIFCKNVNCALLLFFL